jgi:hypothetical protein
VNEPENPHTENQHSGDRHAGDQSPGEAFDRLRAADPAAGSEPRADVLHAKVDALRDAAAGTVAQEGSRPPGGVPAPRSLVTRRRRVLVAAAVAGAVVVGGGGYAVGTMTGGQGGSGVVADLPAIASAGAAREPGTGLEAADSAASSSTYPAYYGRTTFRASGLSEQGGTANAYAFDARDAANAQSAARLAAAFSVPGEVRTQDLSWSVGSDDGSGPQVWLSGDGAASFNYANPEIDPWNCAAPDTETGCPTPPPTTVDDDAATQALVDAMRSLGVDPDQFEVTVEPLTDGDAAARWVTAQRIVGGVTTWDTWSASAVDGGITWLSGSLAGVVDLGEDPGVSPAEAVRRLGDPRFTDSGVGPLVAVDDGAESREGASSTAATDGPTAVPAPPAAGAPVVWPVTEVTITGARLSLSQFWTPSGAALFLPTYELTDDAGTTWTVLAVTEDALDFTVPTR